MVHSLAVCAVAWIGFFCHLCSAAPTSTVLPDNGTTSNESDVSKGSLVCSSDTDCPNGNLSCARGICTCRENYSVLSVKVLGTCLPAKQLGEACTEDVQCSLLDQHAVCRGGDCACDSGFYLLRELNGSLCNAHGGSVTTAGTQLNANMLAVIIALAVMFLGICVALHLFSRARFGNRRTIFNSPHPRLMHIKLGKKKKKMSGSQHLSTPTHNAPVPRHHSFSGNYAPSPLPLNRVPKTRSHECLRSAMRRDSSPKLEMRSSSRAPLAEKESSTVPSTEALDKKTPDAVQLNGVAAALIGDLEKPPGSPTVIITDADGSHRHVVTASRSSSANAVNV